MYEVKVKYLKQSEETGKFKKVSDVYLVDAVSVTESEAIVVKEFEGNTTDVNITGSNKSKIEEVFNFQDSDDWFKCKVQYIDVDQKSGKEKKFTIQVLVNAESSEQAVQRVNESLFCMIVPFTVPSVQLSKIVDYLRVNPEVDESE